MNKSGRPISLTLKPVREKTESEALEEWNLEASQQIKRAIKARGWGYKELSEALRAMGIKRSATVLNRRINRGNFGAGFMLACLEALKTSGTSEKP